nr:YibE/F family protein [Clostridium paraputrificum]
MGQKVVIGYYPNDTKITMGIYSYNRSNFLYILAFIFVISVIIIGGVKGVKSLVALLFTLTCCIFLLIPLMIKGVNPVGASIFIAILSTIVTLLLVSGYNIKTISAIIGTTIGICISGGLTYIFGNLANLSGINISEAENIFFIAERTGLKMHGILFAGILIASLGAIMDVAMSISSSVNEIHSHNNKLSMNKLFLSGMNIGKDIIGTMTNTLILAFTGGSIGILLLVFSYYMPYIKLINLDLLGIEILQGLTGSIGIVLSVPATALVSSYLYKKYSN